MMEKKENQSQNHLTFLRLSQEVGHQIGIGGSSGTTSIVPDPSAKKTGLNQEYGFPRPENVETPRE